jgi:hypothetical protein
MTRNLKVLGLALMAAFALAAVGASGASAATELFHSEVEPTILEGSQVGTHKFTTTAGNVTCSTAVFKGTAKLKTESDQTIHPEYSGCNLSGAEFVSATVSTTGCNYTFTQPNSKAGVTDIVCEVGKNITVTAFGCTITVGPQNNLAVSYKNTGTGAGRDVDVNAEATNVVYSHTGFTCGTGSGTTGTYTGETTVKGYTDTNGTKGSQVGIWVE